MILEKVVGGTSLVETNKPYQYTDEGTVSISAVLLAECESGWEAEAQQEASEVRI